MPTGPADLMLRMVNHMVDSYLDLRRQLTRQLGLLQSELLEPEEPLRRLAGAARLAQCAAPAGRHLRGPAQRGAGVDRRARRMAVEADAGARRERELLRVRSRDVLEHIERVLTHVRRLEHSAEVAVQMHFSALSHRTNDIMRTLTVLTAIFLPLNLITGFFGMNFDGLPLIHSATGIWTAAGMMAAVGVALIGYFRRKRYLGTTAAHAASAPRTGRRNPARQQRGFLRFHRLGLALALVVEALRMQRAVHQQVRVVRRQ
jgi:magnesium transporter